jgi:hypothetical protein
MFHYRHRPFQIFTIAFIAAMFFPRVLPEGMFADSLTYASIARNMAEGRGSFWSPYFSSSFWIPFQGAQYAFYGHPTLAMGMQSVLFKVIGDHWFVEKLYCIIIWCLSVFLMIKLWQQQGRDKHLWWLPVLVWYMMPTVLWSYPNFILDNTMAVFSIISAFIILKQYPPPDYFGTGQYFSILLENNSKSQISIFQLLFAGIFLHLAFLTKGPVGLFPLAIPCIYWFVFEKNIGKKAFLKAITHTFWLFVGSFGTLILWYFYEPARNFWEKYINIQLVSSISENDQTEAYSVWDYFFIPKQLLIQSAPLFGVLLLLFLFSKIKKTAFAFEKTVSQKALFFLLIALSGSLPMMISHKASDYFLLPALPFLALGFCLWLEPTVSLWLDKYTMSVHKSLIINRFMYVLAAGVGVYCLLQIGRVGREKELIHDIKLLSQNNTIPSGAKIAVCDRMMGHFYYHAYFQRYNTWELTPLSDTTTRYFINDSDLCSPMELDTVGNILQYKREYIEGLETLQVFKK